MTHPFRTRRFLVFAASTAAAAGAVLLPTGAFAATPATPHTVVADDGPGNPAHSESSTLLWITPEGSDEGRIVVKPDVQKPQDNRAVNKADHGKIRVHDNVGRGGGLLDPPKDPVWICVAAPCGPPSHARTVAT
ncbi:hypothetical protein [Streptomyces katrae]|uniref:hypothetical protein n=1 Tax=Streptomyces katrae TaxID=68223 RepID=UPI0004BE7F8E|nr:hypothetical protein [Streptomyces katrae]